MFSPINLILAIAAIVLFAMWWNTRNKRYAQALAVVAGLMVLHGIYNLVRPETDEEQIKRKVEEMAKAVESKDVDALMKHVSEEFKEKAILHAAARRAMNEGDVTTVSLSNMSEVSFDRSAKPPAGKLEFRFNVKGPGGQMPGRCQAVFVLDKDGQWRLQGYKLFQVVGDQPLRIPQMPY